MTENNFENILNQYLPKQFFMYQSKRLTRSSSLLKELPVPPFELNKWQLVARKKANKVYNSQNFGSAFLLLLQCNTEDHWLNCKKAHTLFHLQKYKECINYLSLSWGYDLKNCEKCFSLLVQVVKKIRPNVKLYKKIVKQCLQLQMPPQIMPKIQSINSQLNLEKEMRPAKQKDYVKIKQYYKNKGLKLRKLQIIEEAPQYRIVKARHTIKPNQIIVAVPHKQLITLETARQLPEIFTLSLQQNRLRSPKHCILSVFLLLHMGYGQASPYYHYIRCLPKKLENFPVYYSEQQQKELEGTYFLTTLKRKKIDIYEDYVQILSILPDLKYIITYQRFLWARLIISSRIFGVTINGRKTDALVPIADMLNHRHPKMTSWYYCDLEKAFIIQNLSEQIQKGKEIFDSYGSKCNSRFLLNYGFTVPDNENDQVLIILKKFRKYRIVPPIIRLTARIDTEEFRNFINFYRGGVINRQYTDSDIESSQQSYQSIQQACTFISKQNEAALWEAVLQTMKSQLEGYPTSVKEDEKILRNAHANELGINMINCVRMRLGEKRILQFYVKMAKKMIEFFTNQFRKIDVSQYQSYLREIQQLGTQ